MFLYDFSAFLCFISLLIEYHWVLDAQNKQFKDITLGFRKKNYANFSLFSDLT